MARLRIPHEALSVAEMRDDLEARIAVRNVRASRILARMQKAERAQAEALLAIGRALAVILEERLYVNLGHRDFREFLAARGLGRTQAFKWIAIARARIGAARLAEIGVERAYEEARRPR